MSSLVQRPQSSSTSKPLQQLSPPTATLDLSTPHHSTPRRQATTATPVAPHLTCSPRLLCRVRITVRYGPKVVLCLQTLLLDYLEPTTPKCFPNHPIHFHPLPKTTRGPRSSTATPGRGRDGLRRTETRTEVTGHTANPATARKADTTTASGEGSIAMRTSTETGIEVGRGVGTTDTTKRTAMVTGGEKGVIAMSTAAAAIGIGTGETLIMKRGGGVRKTVTPDRFYTTTTNNVCAISFLQVDFF